MDQQKTGEQQKTLEMRAFIARKIKKLDEDTSWARGMLAKLRCGIGKPPGELPGLWEVTLADAPQWDSRRQNAVHAALTLYAMHRQGKQGSMSVGTGESLGAAVARLVESDQSNFEAVKRRFDSAVTASDFWELSHHVRGLIQLLKAKSISMNYPLFAEDLYRYQFDDHRSRVRLRWGQDFYQGLNKTNDGKEEKNNE